MMWKRMPASSQRMGYSRSQAPPLTEQDLCKPKFSLLVEKVRSSLDYNAVDEVRHAWWRITVFDGRLWKHFEAFQGKKKARNQGRLSWNTCFCQSMRLDEFDEELLSLMDRCGNTLKSSKGRKKVRSQGNLSWNVGFYSGEIWLYTKTSVQRLKYCERECRRTVIGETIFQV